MTAKIFIVLILVFLKGCHKAEPTRSGMCKTQIQVEWNQNIDGYARQNTWDYLFDISSEYFLSKSVPIYNTIFFHPDSGRIDLVFNESCEASDRYTAELMTRFEIYSNNRLEVTSNFTWIEGVPYYLETSL